MTSGEILYGSYIDGKFVADGPVVAIQGKEGCTSVECRRYYDPAKGINRCMGWHCGSCGEPADAQGGCSNAECRRSRRYPTEEARPSGE